VSGNPLCINHQFSSIGKTNTDISNSMINYLTLIEYTSRSFAKVDESGSGSHWINDFARTLALGHRKNHEVTSLLALLSAAISNGQSLPPYLETPRFLRWATEVEKFDTDLLGVDHLAEPGYAAFAVMQVASICLQDSLDNILRNVGALVGEMDFSYHVLSTARFDGSTAGNGEADDGKVKVP
jgi:hypothetical protein